MKLADKIFNTEKKRRCFFSQHIINWLKLLAQATVMASSLDGFKRELSKFREDTPINGY